MEVHGVVLILPVGGDKEQGHLAVAAFELVGQGNAVHPLHLNVQKGQRVGRLAVHHLPGVDGGVQVGDNAPLGQVRLDMLPHLLQKYGLIIANQYIHRHISLPWFSVQKYLSIPLAGPSTAPRPHFDGIFLHLDKRAFLPWNSMVQ